MKQTEAKKERSKEQWKREDKKKTLTAIEHEEKESSSHVATYCLLFIFFDNCIH